MQEAYQTYYEDHDFWKDLEDHYKMLSGVPAMTLIDKPITEQSRQIAGDQGNSDEDFREIEIDEVNLIYEIEGIDLLRQINPPRVHLNPKLN